MLGESSWCIKKRSHSIFRSNGANELGLKMVELSSPGANLKKAEPTQETFKTLENRVKVTRPPSPCLRTTNYRKISSIRNQQADTAESKDDGA